MTNWGFWDSFASDSLKSFNILLSHAYLNRVAKPSQVYFGGNIIGESAMKSEDDVGNLIELEFRVSNLD